MKKNKIKKTLLIISALLVMFSFSSCEDFLDRKPLDEATEASYWSSTQDLQTYLNGRYPLLGGNFSGDLGYLGADRRSDNMASIGYVPYLNSDEPTTAPAGIGEGGWDFRDIRAINIFFDNYQKCQDPFERYKHYIGEALFLRAYLYFAKVRRYGDVPWYNSQVFPNDPDLYKPRDKRSLVVDSIIANLDLAIQYLKTRSEVGVNRINKETALIFKTRVALHEGTWAKYHSDKPSESDVDANKMFQIVIDAYNDLKNLTGGFSSVIHDNYAELFNQSDYSSIPEVTLAKHYDIDLGVENNALYLIRGDLGIQYEGNGYTFDLINSFLDKNGQTIDLLTDPELANLKGTEYIKVLNDKLDARFGQVVWIPGETLTENSEEIKFLGAFTSPPWDAKYNSYGVTGFCPKKGYNKNYETQKKENMIGAVLFRVSEALLNYAEAYVELNGSMPDFTDNLDLLRDRTGMPPLTGNLPSVDDSWPDYGYDISENLAIIRNERRIELIGEGFRESDWKRWRAHALFEGKRKKGLKIDQGEYSSPQSIDENGLLDPNSGVAGLADGYEFDESKYYLYPLPLADLELNPNLTQNPGWETP